MIKKELFIVLAVLVMIVAVSVPSAMSYFSTYTETLGTKELHFIYSSEFNESVDGNKKIITIKADADSEPIFVRVKYFAPAGVNVSPIDDTVFWQERNGYYYYYQPIAGGEETKSLVLAINITGDHEEGDVEHVIVIYEAIPAKYNDNGIGFIDWKDANWNTDLRDIKSEDISPEPEPDDGASSTEAEGGE